LDDELQYRCAGYIQAEIERYAEFLDESGETEEQPQQSEGSEEEGMGEGNMSTTPIRPRRAKKARKEGMCEFPLRTISSHVLLLDSRTGFT
jgi:cohesin complex subunit SA-1/2